MKRTLLFLAIISITYSMHAQWKYKEINNPFDGVTRKVYIKGKAISSSSYNPTLVITKSFKTNTIDIQIKDANKLDSNFNGAQAFFLKLMVEMIQYILERY